MFYFIESRLYLNWFVSLFLFSQLTYATDLSSQTKFREVKRFNAALLEAVSNKNLRQTKRVLKEGASVNARDERRRTVLMNAIIANHEVRETLVQEGLGVNVQLVGLPAPKVSKKQRKIISYLIKKGADIEAIDQDGKSAILLAAERGYTNITKILLEAGANPNTKAKSGLPITCIASSRGFVSTLDVLILSGAHLDSRGLKGKHAIHYAAETGELDVIKRLIEAGVNVDVTSDANWTALHTAASMNDLEIASYLKSQGANLDAETARGFKPVSIASARGFEDLASILTN